jgi:hypothetical protein
MIVSSPAFVAAGPVAPALMLGANRPAFPPLHRRLPVAWGAERNAFSLALLPLDMCTDEPHSVRRERWMRMRTMRLSGGTTSIRESTTLRRKCPCPPRDRHPRRGAPGEEGAEQPRAARRPGVAGRAPKEAPRVRPLLELIPLRGAHKAPAFRDAPHRTRARAAPPTARGGAESLGGAVRARAPRRAGDDGVRARDGQRALFPRRQVQPSRHARRPPPARPRRARRCATP